jgi:DNA-binding NarL/FixJ family response regulator
MVKDERAQEPVPPYLSGVQNAEWSVKRPSPSVGKRFEASQLIGQGRVTREVAAHLHLNARTLEVYGANTKRKLGLKSGADLVCYAIRWTETQKPA